MDQMMTIGLDLVKQVFPVVGCDQYGAVVSKKKLRRGKVFRTYALTSMTK